jgi:hypothetical protein
MGFLDWFKRGKKDDAAKPDRTVVNHEEQVAETRAAPTAPPPAPAADPPAGSSADEI